MNQTFAIWTIIVIVVLFFVSLIGFIGWFDIQAARDLAFCNASNSFPETIGTIENADIREFSEDGGTQWSCRFDYVYEVNKTQHRRRTGDEIRKSAPGWPEDWDLNNYQDGTEVPVYYDPANPQRATLYRGTPKSTWIFLTILGVFNLILLVVLYKTIKFLVKLKKWIHIRRREMQLQKPHSG